MKRELKTELKFVFHAPSPTDKERFLKQIRYPQITYYEFLLNQIRYIRKRIWITSAMIVLCGFFYAFHLPLPNDFMMDSSKMWSISALFPFLALVTITEIYRSSAYKMSELEESCRFSLTQIVMARISILGTINVVVFIPLFICFHQVSSYSLLQTILYVVVPHLFVCAVCLWILNRMHGLDSIHMCAISTEFVSISSILFEEATNILYTNDFISIWLIFLVGCLGMIVLQMNKLFKQLEEKNGTYT